jgi:hypothetical protein
MARTVAWSVFGPYAQRAAISGWDLSFPDGSECHLNIADDELVDGFGIQRPNGLPLFEAIYSVLSQSPSIMIMSEDGLCVVANENVISDLPDWLTKALPPPRVVNCGQAIVEHLESANRDR